MPTKPLSREICQQTLDLFKQVLQEGYVIKGMPSAVAETARRMGIDRKIVDNRLKVATKRYGMESFGFATERIQISKSSQLRQKLDAAKTISNEPRLPDFPDDDIPDEQIIDMMCARYARRAEHKASKKWFRIEMPDDKPFAVLWWGDPHLDNNGTNWPLLREHAALASHPHVYSVNIGDTLDNWPHGSRLVKLYADSDTSVATAHKLARWFLKASGINWLVWLFGNHDSWGGHTSMEWTREVGGKSIAFEDWGAQFVLCCPSGAEFKIWAAHNFPGNSQWNSLHGPQKAAAMREEADIYVCGHTHNWALHKEESAARGFSYSLVRARGYKYLDDYGEKLGYHPQQYGASILTVFVPERGRHYNFEHPEDGITFLEALRSAK